jgi:mRNA interferase RelE/StbE
MTNYLLDTTPQFDKQIKKLKSDGKKIVNWLIKNVDNQPNPRIHGKKLANNFKEYWRYRIGKYRVLCKIEDNKLLVIAVKVGKRDEIYK